MNTGDNVEQVSENRRLDPRLTCHIRRTRVQVAAGLLLTIVNPRKNILQVLLGMLAYSKASMRMALKF